MPRYPKDEKQRIKYTALLGGSLLALIITAMLAAQNVVSPLEKEVLWQIYSLPLWLKGPGLVVTQFGSAWILVGLSIYLLIGRKRHQHWGRLIVMNGMITYLVVEIIKLLVARPRPLELVPGLTQRELFIHGFGYPSGHTAMATVISLTLLPYLPKGWRWLPIVWIFFVGLSRIYLGVHAPLDIIGGFAIGLSIISIKRLLRIK